MVIEGALADAGPLQDVGETCFAVTVVGEERDCRIENSRRCSRCAGLDDHWAYPLLFRNAGCLGYLLGQQNPTRALDEGFRGTAENRIKLCRRHQYPLSRLLKLVLRPNTRAVGDGTSPHPRASGGDRRRRRRCGLELPGRTALRRASGECRLRYHGWGSGVGPAGLSASATISDREAYSVTSSARRFVPR